MITDLGLKGNELLIYAVIYGYSNIEGQWYTANQQSLAEFIKTDRTNTNKVVQKLQKKGLVIAEEVSRVGTAKTYRYKAVVPNEPRNEARNECQNSNSNGGQNDNGKYNGGQNDHCTVVKMTTGNGGQNDNGNGGQNDTQYINNNKNIYNNYYYSAEAPHNEQLNGQIEFDTTENFDSYCDKSLNITIKKKIMDMTNLPGIAVKQIVDTANKVNMSDSKLMEVIKYSMTKECKNLAGYIIKTIPNYVEPKQNSSKSGFNNFKGRNYTEKDYEAMEKALLSH